MLDYSCIKVDLVVVRVFKGDDIFKSHLEYCKPKSLSVAFNRPLFLNLIMY